MGESGRKVSSHFNRRGWRSAREYITRNLKKSPASRRATLPWPWKQLILNCVLTIKLSISPHDLTPVFKAWSSLYTTSRWLRNPLCLLDLILKSCPLVIYQMRLWNKDTNIYARSKRFSISRRRSPWMQKTKETWLNSLPSSIPTSLMISDDRLSLKTS